MSSFISLENGNTFICQAIDSQEFECKFLASSQARAEGHAESFEDSSISSVNADGVFEKRSLPFETLNYGKRAKSVVYFVGKRSE